MPMKTSYPIGYYLVALLALAPMAIRALSRPKPPPQAVDAAMAQAGHTLFVHEWTPRDPLAGSGDGLGPVFNATSCVACHHQGGVGGGGGLTNNVTTFTVRPVNGVGKAREGVVHARATKYPETLAQVHSSLPNISQPPLSMLVDI